MSTPTPLYVIKALAEVRDSGRTNLLDRLAVEMLILDQRAAEWVGKANNLQYMDALNDMVLAESDDWMSDEDSDGSDVFFTADYNSDVDADEDEPDNYYGLG